MKKILTALVVIVVAAGFLGLSAPGHRVLNSLGFAMADGGGCSGC
jgi:hypothetical protein